MTDVWHDIIVGIGGSLVGAFYIGVPFLIITGVIDPFDYFE